MSTSIIPSRRLNENRKKVKTMMEEDLNLEIDSSNIDDEDEAEVDSDWNRPTKKKSTTTTNRLSSKLNKGKGKQVIVPTTPPHSKSSPNSSPRLAIKFAGKVYRSLDTTLNSYSREGNFFGEPDEEVGDKEIEAKELKRKELGQKMRMEAGKKRIRRDSDEEDLWIHPPSAESSLTPTKRSIPVRTEPYTSRVLPRTSNDSPPPPLGLPFSTINSSRAAFSSIFSTSTPLPSPLADLLALHTALESALLFHLANEGSGLASSTTKINSKGEAIIKMPSVIDLPDLGKKMESGGKRFGEKELSKLLWVWEGCGMEEDNSDNDDVEDDELNVESQGKEVGGMGFIVSKTRCGSSNGIITTYGIGISVSIKTNPQLPKFELLAPPGSPIRSPKRVILPQSPSSIGKGREGMSVVALWSQGNEARREEFSRRLREWGKRCADEELTRTIQLPTPPRTNSFPSYILEIPRAILPSLSAAIPKIPGTPASPRKKVAVDVFGPAIPISVPFTNGTVAMLMEGNKKIAVGAGTAEQRMQAMRDRIQAKADSRKPSTYHADFSSLADGIGGKKSLKRDKDVGTSWRVEEMERYKRNSMLSRLGNVADAVWMLFKGSNRKSILLYDVGNAVSKSAKINVSLEEATTSLNLLCELSSGFTHIKVVDRQDWLCMKGEIELKEVKEIIREELARSTK